MTRYTVTECGSRLEALGSYHGYRIRISTMRDSGPAHWPVSVHVRGSESEPEVRVDVPTRQFRSSAEAFDAGYEQAVLWIEAEDHRGYV